MVESYGGFESYMRLQMFIGADRDAILPILSGCPVRDLQRGEVLLAPGTRNTILFILLSGKLSIHLASLQERPLTQIEPGECVGELSVVSGEAVTAYVVAAEPSRLLAIPQSTLWNIFNASYIVARNLLVILSMRVRLSNSAIMDAECRRRVFEQYARSDTLTGVYNRRHLDDLLARLTGELSAGGQGFAFLMLDIDHFKNFNDTHGHLGGDSVLSTLGKLLDAGVRCVDTVTRYGGEEFAVVLPGIGIEGALEIAQRLRMAVSCKEIVHCDGRVLPSVTISVGLCTAIPGQTPEEVIATADEALYRAKEDGRDRVCVSGCQSSPKPIPSAVTSP